MTAEFHQKVSFLLLIFVIFLIPVVSAGDAVSRSELESSSGVARTLSSTSASPGETITVSLTPGSGLQTSPGWGVIETLPGGLTYITGSSTADGTEYLGENRYQLTRLTATAISYQLHIPVSTPPGTYTLSGTYVGGDKENGTVSGEATITVDGETSAGVTRYLSSTGIGPGGTVTVTLAPSSDLPATPGWGAVETLSGGLAYVEGSSTADSVETVGEHQYQFTMLEGSSITYQVTTPSTEGTCTITGTYTDGDKNTGTIGGETIISVSQVIRTLSCTDISPGGTVTITLTPDPSMPTSPGWGVVDTLSEGLEYVEGSSTADSIESPGVGQYQFTMLEDAPFSYQVTAPTACGNYSISGTYTDGEKDTGPVGGSSTIGVIDVIARYTDPATGTVTKATATEAIYDYLYNDVLCKADAVAVVDAYLAG